MGVLVIMIFLDAAIMGFGTGSGKGMAIHAIGGKIGFGDEGLDQRSGPFIMGRMTGGTARLLGKFLVYFGYGIEV